MVAQGQLIILAISLLGGFIGKLEDNSALIRNAVLTDDYTPLEKLVIGVLEEAKALFFTGVPEMGIPVLDPLILDPMPLNLELPGIISADILLTDGLLTGLSNFNVTELKININGEAILPLDALMEITFNDIQFVINYGINGTFGDLIDMSCDGLIALALKKLKIKIFVKTGEYCGVYVLDELSIGWEIPEYSYFLLNGFMNDETLSKEISEIVTWVLKEVDLGSIVEELISPEMKNFVNKILAFLFFKVPV